MKANDRESRFDVLTELHLRPVSAAFNQIRYWSALDDPAAEKWDYVSHYTRTERREMGRGTGAGFSVRPLLVGALILLLLIGVGTGGYLAWPYLEGQLSALGAGAGQEIQVVTGYMVHLGSRDLGVVQDRAAVENFISSWLAQKNAQSDIVYRIAQEITYEEVRVDAAYCATPEEVESAFVKHATLDLA